MLRAFADVSTGFFMGTIANSVETSRTRPIPGIPVQGGGAGLRARQRYATGTCTTWVYVVYCLPGLLTLLLFARIIGPLVCPVGLRVPPGKRPFARGQNPGAYRCFAASLIPYLRPNLFTCCASL